MLFKDLLHVLRGNQRVSIFVYSPVIDGYSELRCGDLCMLESDIFPRLDFLVSDIYSPSVGNDRNMYIYLKEND